MKKNIFKLILLAIPMFTSQAFAASGGAFDEDESSTCLTCANKSIRNSGGTNLRIEIPKNLPANQSVALSDTSELRSIDDVERARITFYNPNMNTRMEGGPRTRFGERINSVEDAIKNGRAVSVAGDRFGDFGKQCNRRKKRCLLVIHLEGFDKKFRGYREKFPHLPDDSFLAIVEDTGSAFNGRGSGRLDIASRSRALADAVPAYMNDQVKYMRLKNPCGHDTKGRTCNFANSQLSGKTRTAMGLSDPSA